MSITEGFICPECMKKCVSLKNLQDHFQQIHIDQIEIPSDQSGFLGIIKKAKKTFEEILDAKDGELIFSNNLSSNTLKNENNDMDDDPFVSHAFYEEPNIKPQPLGITVNRTEEFLKFRRTKLLRSAIETSSLILKIEKLISFQSNASNRERKNFEQSIVEWVKDDLVPMCPMCGGKFGINSPISTYSDVPAVLSSNIEQQNTRKQSRFKTAFINFMDMEIEGSGLLIRKKHHCRLCGCVICAHCSYILSAGEASKLVNAINSRFELKESLLEESRKILWKNDSQNSLDSIKSKIKTQTVYSIRCCGNCKSLIEAKWNQLERRVCDSEIVDLYEELMENRNKVSQLIPEYNTMCQSLCLGETEYSYQRANELRSEIVQFCQKIDAIGNKFKSRTTTNGSEREATLVKSIYRNTFLFLQNNFATLKQLPQEDKLEEIVNQRLIEIKKKAATMQKNRSPEIEKYLVKSNNDDSGWAPTIPSNCGYHNEGHNRNTNNPFECDSTDSNTEENTRLTALALQMENVRQYIELAHQAKKVQEVKMLQNNMLDLKLEYDALRKKLKI